MGETVNLGVDSQMLLPVRFLGDVREKPQDVVYILAGSIVEAVGDPIGAGSAVGAGELHPLLVSFGGHGLQELVAGRFLVRLILADFREVLDLLRQPQQPGAGWG